jgi:drug/metabolite transporter, DME family
MKERLPYFYVLLAAMCWGTTGTSQALAPTSAHPIAIGTIRLVIGGITLLIVVYSLGQLKLKGLSYKNILFASICMAFYQPLFFSGVHLTGVAIGTVIGIGSAPILAGFIEWIFLKHRPGKVWWIATLLSVIGCLFLFMNREGMEVNTIGVVLSMGAGLAFAIFTLVSKELLEKNKPLPVMAIIFTLSGIFLSPLLLFVDLSWILELEGILVSLELGIVATGLAYWLFALGLKHIPSSSAVTLSLAEPLTATLLGVFIVGEHLSLLAWIGIGFILLGLGVLSFTPGQHKKDSKETFVINT